MREISQISLLTRDEELKLAEKNHIRIKNAIGSYKERKIPCFSQDSKKTFVSTRNKSTAGRVNFITGKGKRKKYLSVVVK